MSTVKLNAVGLRWVNELAEYDFEIQYRPGKKNGDADGLSRNTMTGEQELYTHHVDEETIKAVWSGALESTRNVNVNTTGVQKIVSMGEIKDIQITAEMLSAEQNKDEIIGPVYRLMLSGIKFSKKELRSLDRATKI